MIKLNDGSKLKLREDFEFNDVDIKIDGYVIRSFKKYADAAMHIQGKYDLSDTEMLQIYEDYKENYDKRCKVLGIK